MDDSEAAALTKVVMQGSNPVKNPFNLCPCLCGNDLGGAWTAYPFNDEFFAQNYYILMINIRYYT